ncbi:MAG: ATP-binding protein [Desulfovibrionaceae bacterium]
MKNSIRSRLTLNFIGLAVLPLVLVGIVLGVVGFAVQKKQALALERAVAMRVASRTSDYLANLEDHLALASNLTGLRTLPPDGQKQVLLSLLYSSNKYFEEISLLDATGMERLRVSRHRSIDHDDLRNRAYAPEYREVLATRKTYFGRVRFDGQTGEPYMLIAKPISELRTGQVVNILVAEARLKRVWELIMDVRLGLGENVYIVDNRRRVVAHRNPSVVLANTRFTAPDVDGLDKGLEGAWAVIAREQVNLGGQTFTVVAERLASNALSLAVNAVVMLIAVIAASLCVAVALAFFAVRRIVRPIQVLATTANAVRAGELDLRAAVESSDEIGVLAQAFNDMTDRLSQSLEGLQEKIHELTETESKLRDSESKYRAHYEQASEGICLTGEQGHIIDANSQLLTMLGCEMDDLQGMPIVDLVHPEDLAVMPPREAFEIVRSGATLRMEQRFRRKDGSYFTASLSAKDIGGGRVQIMVRDITIRKQMENDLIAARKAAEEANLSKSLFLRNMSHEVRTPIGCVIGMAELTLETDLEPEQREQVEMILDSAVSLMEIINDILDFNRIEAGKLQLSPATFNVRREVEKLTRHFATQAARRETSLLLTMDPGVPETVKADPGRLGQVLRNLVGNALKFTERGTVHVTVLPGTTPDTLQFSVADTGVGVPKDKQHLLFSSFAQLDSSYSKRFAGTGLGLAISKKLVEMMGGSIWFESEHKKGSTFYFTIRVEPPEDAPASAPPVREAPRVDMEPLNILFAEDNRVNRLFVSDFLKRNGHSVTAVENGLKALEALERERFDVIVMDIQMPEMDGVEATRIIRSSSPKRFDPRIPIIALTAYAMKDDKDRFFEEGMNGYVSKPVDQKLLLLTLQDVTRGKKTDEDA